MPNFVTSSTGRLLLQRLVELGPTEGEITLEEVGRIVGIDDREHARAKFYAAKDILMQEYGYGWHRVPNKLGTYRVTSNENILTTEIKRNRRQLKSRTKAFKSNLEVVNPEGLSQRGLEKFFRETCRAASY